MQIVGFLFFVVLLFVFSIIRPVSEPSGSGPVGVGINTIHKCTQKH